MRQYLPNIAKFVSIVFGMWLATYALVEVTKNKFEALQAEKAEMSAMRPVSGEERARQLRCLTQNISNHLKEKLLWLKLHSIVQTVVSFPMTSVL